MNSKKKENSNESCKILADYIAKMGFKTPLSPFVQLVSLKDRNNRDGNQKRYFKVYAKSDCGLFDITKLCANVGGFYYSKNGCAIVHGCGMDMGFHLVNEVREKLCSAGYENLFGETYAGIL